MITIDTISKKYGKAEVLNVPLIEIPTGESFGLVGNNGAGKTTLFNILLDLIRPTTGKITNNNVEVNTSEDWKNFTGSFIDESFLIGYLTPDEYFDFIGDLRGMNKADVKLFLTQFGEFFNDEVLGKKKYLPSHILKYEIKSNEKATSIYNNVTAHSKYSNRCSNRFITLKIII